MQDKQIKLTIGSLLHDIGKVVYRAGDSRQHSASGGDFLKETRTDFDSDILKTKWLSILRVVYLTTMYKGTIYYIDLYIHFTSSISIPLKFKICNYRKII